MKDWSKSLIGLILGLLGFSSCDWLMPPCMYGSPELPAEYGTPHATFKFQAEATDTDDKPVPGIRVVVAPQGLSGDKYTNDTLYTDALGKAAKDRLTYDWPDYDHMTVVFEDVDGEENGLFETQTLDASQLEINQIKQGESFWDSGEYLISAKARLATKEEE